MAPPTTAASGVRSRRNGSSAPPSRRTGLPSGSGSSKAAGDEGADNGSPNGGAKNGATNGGAKNGATKSRARRLFRFDRGLGVRFVAGADEAGRGCLAGPLVAAAVLFDYERLKPGDVRLLSALDDSKAHSPDARSELYPRIFRVATRIVVTSRCVRGIDERGLHRTNLAALRDVLRSAGRPGCICLSDGFPVGPTGWDQRHVVGGDARSAAIAAASVIAKVTRDRFMRRIAAEYPGWDFEEHVGYSTPEHRAAIERLGISPLHRLSFQSIAYQQLEL